MLMRKSLHLMLVVITMGIVIMFGTASSGAVRSARLIKTEELFWSEMEEVERGLRLLIRSLLNVMREEEAAALHYRQNMDYWLRDAADLFVLLHVEVSWRWMRAGI
jgi:predicted DNA-binding ribbon-helix-helix protein